MPELSMGILYGEWWTFLNELQSVCVSRGLCDNMEIENCGKNKMSLMPNILIQDFVDRGVPAAMVWKRNHPEEVFYV